MKATPCVNKNRWTKGLLNKGWAPLGMGFALLLLGCPGTGDGDGEPVQYTFDTVDCAGVVAGSAATTAGTRTETGIDRVDFRIVSADAAQALELFDADNVPLGTLVHQFSATTEGRAELVAQSRLSLAAGGEASQTSRYRIAGEKTVVETVTAWADREIILDWAIRTDGVIPFARMSTRVPEATSGVGIVRKVNGTFRVLDLFVDGERTVEPDEIVAFLEASNYPIGDEESAVQRLMRVATDAQVRTQMDASAQICGEQDVEEGALAFRAPSSVEEAVECNKGGNPLSDVLTITGGLLTVLDGGVGVPGPAGLGGGFGASGAGLAVAIGTAAGVTTGAGAVAAIVVGVGIAFAIGALVDKVVAGEQATIVNGFGDLVLGNDPGRSDAISSFYGGGAKSTGDPHLTTLDGESYDFQSTGDFRLMRAESGTPFEVQVRQAPMYDTVCPGAALNTALAAQVGAHRFVMEADASAGIEVDGVVIDLLENEVFVFDDGTRLVMGRAELAIDSPEGDSLYVQLRGFHIGVFLAWESGRATNGLLGNNNGMVGDDLGLPSGVAPSFDHLHSTFADTHRLTAEDALFNYDNGMSPTDFIVAGYPTGPLNVEDLSPAQIEPAEVACREAGIEEEPVLTHCILDLACTLPADHAGFLATHAISRGGQRVDVLQPIPLSDWTQQGEPSAGVWTVSDDGRSVVQSVNGQPTFFVSPDDYFGVRVEGTLDPILTDDDIIGFVFGYQGPLGDDDPSSYDTFVVSWKGREQGVPEGLRLLHVHGSTAATSNNAVFWDSTATDVVDILDSDTGEGTGWRTKPVRFSVLYTETRISVSIDGEERLSLNAEDSPIAFEPGRFGFYNFSQSNTRYADFAVGPPTAEPQRTACTLTYTNADATNIAADTTWGGGCTDVVVERSVGVTAGTLQVVPGTTVRFDPGIFLSVRDAGQLLLEGEAGLPILLIGTEPVKGHWGGVSVETAGPNNRWSHVTMRHTGASGFQFNTDALIVTGPSTTTGRIALSDCTFETLGGDGLDLWVGAEVEIIERNTFRDVDGAAMRVPLANVHQVAVSNDIASAGADAAIDVVTNGNDPGLNTSVTWPAHAVPYRFADAEYRIIGAGTVLTIAPGSRLHFDGGALDVSTGALSAMGTALAPIVFDAANGMPGGWEGIFVRSASADNLLEHVVVDNAGASGFQFEQTAIIVTGDGTTPGTLTLRDSTVSNSAGSAVLVRTGGTFVDEGNTYVNNVGGDVVAP